MSDWFCTAKPLCDTCLWLKEKPVQDFGPRHIRSVFIDGVVRVAWSPVIWVVGVCVTAFCGPRMRFAASISLWVGGYGVAYWPTRLQILSSAAPHRNGTALSGVQSFQQISVINPSTITTPYILVFTSYITCSLFYYVSTHMLHIIFPPSSCNSLCHLCQLCLAVVLLLDHLVRLLWKLRPGLLPRISQQSFLSEHLVA